MFSWLERVIDIAYCQMERYEKRVKKEEFIEKKRKENIPSFSCSIDLISCGRDRDRVDELIAVGESV